MKKTTLGLDLGPNSIGWALLSENSIIDLGVRVFPEGVDAFDTSKEKSRNEDRRIARGMRRQVRRRTERRKKLIEALMQAGLWPAGSAHQLELYERDPYELRARGLREKLEPHEIGRVLLHLNQRRGFLSNRKRDREDKEVKGMLGEIKENEQERIDGGFETIGELLAAKHRKMDHTNRDPEKNDRVRNRHLEREQFETEFSKIWEHQRTYHPELLTDRLRWGALGELDGKEAISPSKPISNDDPRREGLTDLEAFGLHGLIFFQRKMYWPKSVVGLCELEPKQKRCPRADRHAERFRVLQEVNNLRYADPDTDQELPLNDEQRALLLDYLSKRNAATFKEIRTKLGFLESVKFNLERGKRSSIKGFVLDHMLASLVGKGWHKRDEEEKDSIIDLLRDNERDDDRVVETLISQYDFTAEDAEKALDADLPPGYGNLSRMAIDKLLPHLEKGMVYQSISDPEVSALHAAGYLRRDELQRRLFDVLPDLKRTNPADCKLGDIPNSVVKRALVELRKVVNAIIREHGKPDAIHVEMTRDLVMGPEKRSEYNSRIRKREQQREEAAKAIRNLGVKVRREGILRYLLWQEQAHECVYCGKAISQGQLFGGEVDIDHILPYSRCLDDSQMNKVVCHQKCNHAKANRTPFEWKADAEPDDYARICQHVGSLLRKGLLPYPKYRRFLQKEIELSTFIARQLTDTGYIARATVEYLKLLFAKDEEHAVLGLKGSLTAELRSQLGLSTVLEEIPDSPGWQDKQADKLRTGEKNRSDHRHHAIDAVIIALTNRSRLQQLSESVRRGGARKHGEILPGPWEGFRDDVLEKIKALNVSHRVERKVRGALHEETLYGPTENPEEWVVRKPVIDLSAAEVDRIRDKAIKQIVIDKLEAAGVAYGRGKKPSAGQIKEALSDLKMPSGVPIKKVRLIKPEKTIDRLREEGAADQAYVKPGSTHHLCIFEFEEKGKKKREAVFVTMLEATKRLKRQKKELSELVRAWKDKGLAFKEIQTRKRKAMGEISRKYPVIERVAPANHPTIPPDAKFIMSLSRREIVLANIDGTEKLMVFKTGKSTTGQLEFCEHTDARKSSEQAKYQPMVNTLDARKVTVHPLGRIRWAND